MTLRCLDDQFRKRKRQLYVALLDKTRAFDSVPRVKLFEILRRYYKIDPQLVDAIEALYHDNTGVVHHAGVSPI